MISRVETLRERYDHVSSFFTGVCEDRGVTTANKLKLTHLLYLLSVLLFPKLCQLNPTSASGQQNCECRAGVHLSIARQS